MSKQLRMDASDLIRGGLTFWSDETGHWPDVVGPASVAGAQALQRIANAAERIHDLLASVGHDGIHDIIREHARRARETAKRRRRRERERKRKARKA